MAKMKYKASMAGKSKTAKTMTTKTKGMRAGKATRGKAMVRKGRM